MSTSSYNAVIRRDGEWWIGWVEEVPGVNSQGSTRDELLANLREALSESLEMNREDAIHKEKTGELTQDESSELDHFMKLEHLMRLAKARARALCSQ